MFTIATITIKVCQLTLDNYLFTMLKKYNKSKIRYKLLKQGWTQKDVENYLEKLDQDNKQHIIKQLLYDKS